MSAEERRRVLAALIAVQVMFAIHYPATKVLLRHVEPGAWIAIRMGAGALLFVALWGAGFRRRLEWSDHLTLAGLSIFGVVFNQICFIEGMARTTPAHSSVIMTTVPVLTLVFAVALRRERLRAGPAAGVALAMAGVLLLLRVDRLELRAEWFTGDLLTQVNAASFALFLVISRDTIRRLGPVTATAGVLCWGNLGAALYGREAIARLDWAALPLEAWLLIAYAVVFPTVTAYFLNYWALARVESSSVALFIYLQPVLAATISAVWLGEPLTPRLFASSGLVFLGVLFATRRR